MKKQLMRVSGMTCSSCAQHVEKAVRALAGVARAEVNLARETLLVEYDETMLTAGDLRRAAEQAGYGLIEQEAANPESSRVLRAAGLLVVIIALYFLLEQLGLTQLFGNIPLAREGMSYGMLFVIGLITSVHCVAMCGGLSLSQCIPQAAKSGVSAVLPTILYNLGRVISYTVVGGIVGALGSVISLSGPFKGLIQLLAGVFMVVMGVNMLGLFPSLRVLTPRLPRFLRSRVEKARQKVSSSSPLVVGLLNGLMPCGPLQAMQLYALSAGSALGGALSMLLFSLGTVPLMFGLGALSAVLSKKFTRRMMAAGAVLVAVLGLTMFTQGLSLSGFALTLPSRQAAQSGGTVTVENGVQYITSTLQSGRYPAITVLAGIPVQWTIAAPEGSVNGCNYRMVLPEYGIEHEFQTGDNVLTFTPGKTGSFPYSCWMGMIRGTVTVVEGGEPAENLPESSESPPLPAEPSPAGVEIPAETVAVAELDGQYQYVSIELTDAGFYPAVVVVQADIQAQWVVHSRSERAGNASLLFPSFYQQFPVTQGENPLLLYPTEDFAFSTQDNAFFGYIKVVPDLQAIDLDEIKKEVREYETIAYPPDFFQYDGLAPSCH